MTCPVCECQQFSFKCKTYEGTEEEISFMGWMCDNCNNPLIDKDVNDKFALEIYKLWERITNKKETKS